MSKKEITYAKRVKPQSRDITAYETTAFFKKKEWLNCDKIQLDLDTYYKMPCVRDLSTDVNQMCNELCSHDISTFDYCNTVFSNFYSFYQDCYLDLRNDVIAPFNHHDYSSSEKDV